MNLNSPRPLFIFCGGNSRRIGHDKALLTIQGKSFLAHLADRAGDYFSTVALLSNRHTYDLDLPGYPDTIRDSGPLGGLLSALNVSPEPVIATITVDAPLISSRLLSLLATKELSDNTEMAVVESAASLYPLTGLFRTNLFEKLNRQLIQKNFRVVDFIKNCAVESIPCTENEMMNINTIHDYNQWVRDGL